MHGRIFALRSRGQRRYRVPERRVGGLIAQGVGGPFTASRRVPLRGWVAVPTHDTRLSERLAEPALHHVRGLGPA